MRRPTRRHLLSRAVAAFAAAALAPARVRSAGRKPREHLVEIEGFAFLPDRLRVAPGDRVTWVNKDIAPHTATAVDGSWDTGTIRAGEAASLVVGNGQAETYICRFHPQMSARLALADGGRDQSARTFT